jgi:transposase-like protein
MNPREIFCPNIACPARGQTGKGKIQVHSQQQKRYICEVCGQTFATTKGTIFYRLRTSPQIVMCVIVLLAYGCPILAIVKAFLLDERTVRDWQRRAGQHCQRVHEHLVENSQHDVEQVQADEIHALSQIMDSDCKPKHTTRMALCFVTRPCRYTVDFFAVAKWRFADHPF